MSTKESHQQVESMMNFIAYADGTLDLIAIADIIKVDVRELYGIIDKLIGENLLEIVE
jgi:aminopeptidase-like protein